MARLRCMRAAMDADADDTRQLMIFRRFTPSPYA